MGQKDSNKGTTGLESIRLNGMKIDNLPIAEGAHTKAQWADIQEADKQNTITNIRAKYPTQTVAWVTGAIREAEDTINRVRNLSAGQQQMINEYTGFISICEFRDQELAKTDDPEKIKELKAKFPMYNVKAMKTQIKQCKEAIERSAKVIDGEHKSISELRELKNTCEKRNAELKPYGVTVG